MPSANAIKDFHSPQVVLKNDAALVEIVPANKRNGAATTAVAFVTYSLIPYLGILFCPGAVLMGMVGWLTSRRVPGNSGRQASFTCMLAGLFILGVQVFLWWLLYKVPAWSGIHSAAGATGPPF